MNAYIYSKYIVYIHVDEIAEGMKKEAARSYKQQSKATQHTQGSHFSKEKLAASGGTRMCTCFNER